MNNMPEAFFDSLYLTDSLDRELDGVSFSEINLFSYLACLLSLYDSNPVSFWGYRFIKNKYGSPYSYELEDSINKAKSNEYIIFLDDNYFELTNEGKEILSILKTHTQYKSRLKYLRVSYECITMLPYGLIKESITNEPLITSANNKDSRNILIETDSGAISILYNHFEILKLALDDKYDDLMVPATVWLRKIFEKKAVRL